MVTVCAASLRGGLRDRATNAREERSRARMLWGWGEEAGVGGLGCMLVCSVRCIVLQQKAEGARVESLLKTRRRVLCMWTDGRFVRLRVMMCYYHARVGRMRFGELQRRTHTQHSGTWQWPVVSGECERGVTTERGSTRTSERSGLSR
jgi:hypothetical protein